VHNREELEFFAMFCTQSIPSFQRLAIERGTAVLRKAAFKLQRTTRQLLITDGRNETVFMERFALAWTLFFADFQRICAGSSRAESAWAN
jgi:hypothetical protein